MSASHLPASAATIQAAPEKPGSCGLKDCRFGGLEQGGSDLCQELFGISPAVEVPGLPPSFSLLLEAFPLGVDGCHVLLTPRRHFRSLAAYPDQNELRQATQAAIRAIQRIRPDAWLLYFEHGPGEIDGRSLQCGGCHVDHAHGHLLALSREVLFEDVLESTEAVLENLDWDLDQQRMAHDEPFSGLDEFTSGRPYLHVGRITENGAESFTYRQLAENQSIPSQLLRRLIAEADGRPQPSWWNWKIVLQHNLTDRLDSFGKAVDACRRDLSDALSGPAVEIEAGRENHVSGAGAQRDILATSA